MQIPIQALLFASLALTPARAAGPDSSDRILKALSERFARADANHDSKLNREEAKAGMPKVFKNFDLIDTDKKGYVTLEEILKAFRKGR